MASWLNRFLVNSPVQPTNQEIHLVIARSIITHLSQLPLSQTIKLRSSPIIFQPATFKPISLHFTYFKSHGSSDYFPQPTSSPSLLQPTLLRALSKSLSSSPSQESRLRAGSCPINDLDLFSHQSPITRRLVSILFINKLCSIYPKDLLLLKFHSVTWSWI